MNFSIDLVTTTTDGLMETALEAIKAVFGTTPATNQT
jgi:hypothetical protein